MNPINNVYIEFEILQNSDIEPLINELKYIINLGRCIYVWNKTVPLEEMAAWCITHDISEYIWDYKVKDSFTYSAVDFIIDNNEQLVKKFKKQRVNGNYITGIRKEDI